MMDTMDETSLKNTIGLRIITVIPVLDYIALKPKHHRKSSIPLRHRTLISGTDSKLLRAISRSHVLNTISLLRVNSAQPGYVGRTT